MEKLNKNNEKILTVSNQTSNNDDCLVIRPNTHLKAIGCKAGDKVKSTLSGDEIIITKVK